MNRQTSNYTLTLRTLGNAEPLLNAALQVMKDRDLVCTNSRVFSETAVVSYRATDDTEALIIADQIRDEVPATFRAEISRVHTGLGVHHRDVS